MQRLEEEEKKQSHEEPEDVPLEVQSQRIDELEFKVSPEKSGRRKWRVLIILFLAILLLVILFLRLLAFQYPQKQSANSLKQTSSQIMLPSADKISLKKTLVNTSSTIMNNQKNINHESLLANISIRRQSQNNESVILVEQKVKYLGRIIWVQTDEELAAKQMQIDIAAQNFIHFGKQANYEVRIVDNLNAYDWLSEQMIAFIKDTHQKSKVDLPVYELLRLALLYEHGGVSIRFPNIVLLENLDWVEGLLQGGISQVDMNVLSCQSQGQVLVHHKVEEGGTIWFKDGFIAAKPYSQLFQLLLTQISRIVKIGTWPFPDHNITTVDNDTEVVSFPFITENLINYFHRQYSNQNSSLCNEYGLQSFHESQGIFMGTIPVIPVNISVSTFKVNQNQFFKDHGKKYLLKLEMSELIDDLVNVIKTGDLTFGEDNSLLKNKLIMVEGNRWLSTPSRKDRQVQFCIISLVAMRTTDYELQIKEQMNHLAKQTFTKWNLVNFIKDLPSISQKTSEQVILVNASEYEGLNLQRAATKYCDPASVMFLLDHDEALATEKDLEILANHFKPIGAFAAFLHIRTINHKLLPSLVTRQVRRKTNHPNKNLLSEISNLMRLFTVQSYRFIASFDLRHSSGRYFDREIPLLAMLELSEHFSPCEKGRIAYKVRRLEEQMAIPRQKVFTNITIKTNRVKNVDTSQFEYFAKLRHRHLCGTIKFYQDYVAPVETMVVFNDGREEQGLASRKGMPDLIPRRIHQIWVRGEIPNFKKFLMKRLRDAHPDYEYFLWTESNITRENFPEGYDLMQTILEWDKKSPYNKMSVISDIIRSEAVHAHGGFYLDTNYMLFAEHALDQFLSYSFVTAGELSPRQRMFRDTAIFGATKHNPRLARLISHRMLSSRNFFSKRAAKEAGPGLFGRALRGKEELVQDVFQPSFEEFYPNFLYDPGNPNYNKCQVKRKVTESEIQFKSNKKAYLKNCSKIYPYAFGLDYFGEGLSWQKRKWK